MWIHVTLHPYPPLSQRPSPMAWSQGCGATLGWNWLDFLTPAFSLQCEDNSGTSLTGLLRAAVPERPCSQGGAWEGRLLFPRPCSRPLRAAASGRAPAVITTRLWPDAISCQNFPSTFLCLFGASFVPGTVSHLHSSPHCTVYVSLAPSQRGN